MATLRSPFPKVPPLHGEEKADVYLLPVSGYEDEEFLPRAEAVPINSEEPSAPPLDHDQVPLLDGNGKPFDLRDQTNETCCQRRCSCCNCVSCCWEPSLKKYIFYGFADLG